MSEMRKKRDLFFLFREGKVLSAFFRRGGKDVVVMVRRDNSWFVNGGERTERVDEWAIWRRYTTSLTVNYLESIEKNGVKVEVTLFLCI